MSKLAAFLTVQLRDTVHSEVAARMGISKSQLCKAMQGAGCHRTTVVKITAGISRKPIVRAMCLAAYLSDIAALVGSDARHIRITVA